MHVVDAMEFEEEDADIPVEWVDADEWEALEAALASATSHSHQSSFCGLNSAGANAAGLNFMTCFGSDQWLSPSKEPFHVGRSLNVAVCRTLRDGTGSSAEGARECGQSTGVQEPDNTSETDEDFATVATGAATSDRVDELGKNVESGDVGREVALEQVNELVDDLLEKPRRALPAWIEKTMREPVIQAQVPHSQIQSRGVKEEMKPMLIRANLSQLTDPWSITRPASKEPLFKTLYLQFKGQIVYSKTYSEVNAAAHIIWEMVIAKRSISPGSVAVGFDLEWKPSFLRGGIDGKVAVMQLCLEPSRCDVMHIVHSGIPPCLVTFLADSSILKTGVGLYGDAAKLRRDYGIRAQGIMDLSVMANERLETRCQSTKHWSLSSLAQELTCKQVEKVTSIRTGNWEACPLSVAQLQYAATDAFASLHLYQILESFPSRIVKIAESGCE